MREMDAEQRQSSDGSKRSAQEDKTLPKNVFSKAGGFS